MLQNNKFLGKHETNSKKFLMIAFNVCTMYQFSNHISSTTANTLKYTVF